jgi:hypothetical protein
VQLPVRYHLTLATVGALLIAAFVVGRVSEVGHGQRRYPLPGEPMPKVDYGRLISPPPAVQEVTKAIVTPLVAASQSLRPLTEYLFPTYWDDPKAPASEAPYAVRDSALRMVRESL